MKVVSLLLLLVAFTAAGTVRCPAKDGRRTVFLPDPRSCFSFYICSNGRPIKQYCPKGLEFNPLLKVCDWPNRSFCFRRAETEQEVVGIENFDETAIAGEVNEPTTEVDEASSEVVLDVATGLRCPAKDGRKAVLLPNPRSCSSFYICSNGRPIKQYCPKRLEFNPLLKVCDWPNRSFCFRKAESEQEVVGIENSEETAIAGEVNEAATEVDEAFSEVVLDVATGLRCPAKDGHRAVLLPNPRSCSSFYICSNGRPIKQYCPKGLEFNPLWKVCDWPNRSFCFRRAESEQEVVGIENSDETAIASEVNEAPTEVDEVSSEVVLDVGTGLKCPAKDGRKAVLLPNPRSCSSFYICSNGRPIKQYCPRGLEFNPLLKVCDWPNRSLCFRRAESLQVVDEIEVNEAVIEVEKASSEVILDFARGLRCPAKDGRRAVLLPNPRSCSTFYICSNGRPIKQYCPRGLEFNPLLKVCDWPNRSLCFRRAESVQDETESNEEIEFEVTQTADEISETSNVVHDVARGLRCPAKDGRKAVLLPNPRSCSSFYICSNGTPIKQYCPKGLEFNPLLKVCDWPYRSFCFRRVESPQNATDTGNPSAEE